MGSTLTTRKKTRDVPSQEVYQNAVRIWEKPDCFDCFDNGPNGELQLKKTTMEFNNSIADYVDCRDRYGNNFTKLCRECRPFYDKAKKFYSE